MVNQIDITTPGVLRRSTVLTGAGPEVFQLLWSAPPDNWTLDERMVHVWSVLLDQPRSVADALTATLSRDEKARASRFRFEQERERFAVGRGFLRQILARYLEADPSRIVFQYGPQGKPSLVANTRMRPLAFNASHSNKLLLVAVTSEGSIGVDVERICWLAEADRIAQRFFSPEEKVRLRRASTDQKLAVFFGVWTRKEALLKSAGKGIGELEEPSPNERFQGLIEELMPACGYIGAVAAQGKPIALRTWQWLVQS